MSLKLLTQLSHFITMIFGIALGMSLCMLYQYQINLFISDLSPMIIISYIFDDFKILFSKEDHFSNGHSLYSKPLPMWQIIKSLSGVFFILYSDG